MREVRAVLRRERRKVRRNRERYDDVILAAESLLALAEYGRRGRKRGVPGAGSLRGRVEKAWGRDRQTGDPMRLATRRGRATQSMIHVLKAMS